MMENIHKSRFRVQKFDAKRRGIEWRLTFEQWLTWWLEADIITNVDRDGAST